MKYLCLAYIDEAVLDDLPTAEWQVLVDESLESDERLRARGMHVSSEALESIRSATSVRVRNGKPMVTDGPFAETKEHLGGFILIDAPDLDAAIAVASAMPQARLGCIEIRPVRNLLAATEEW